MWLGFWMVCFIAPALPSTFSNSCSHQCHWRDPSPHPYPSRSGWLLFSLVGAMGLLFPRYSFSLPKRSVHLGVQLLSNSTTLLMTADFCFVSVVLLGRVSSPSPRKNGPRLLINREGSLILLKNRGLFCFYPSPKWTLDLTMEMTVFAAHPPIASRFCLILE